MNEQATMMNQQQQQQLMNMNQSLMSTSMNQMHQLQQQQPKPQVINFNQKKLFAHPYSFSQSSDLNDFRPQMVQMNRSFRMWPPPPQQQFRTPNSNPGTVKPPSTAFNKSLAPRNKWKGKKVNNKLNDKRSIEQKKSLIGGVNGISGGGNLNFENFNRHRLNELQRQNQMKSLETGGVDVIGGGGNMNFENFNHSTLNELQRQNLRTRNFFPKRKFNKNNSMNANKNMNGNHSRTAPFAPRNTTSFIIRSKKSGGIAPLVSPCPVTPAVLPTPVLSPSRELLVDMAKEEWGVDGYGSMKGLIRLRSPGHEMEEEEDNSGSSESDVEEHVEMEKRLDHDLSRFEMIYDPNSVNASGMVCNNVLENRVDDQDSHIAKLEKDNSILKEKLFLMERELGDLRRRMVCLERMGNGGDKKIYDGGVENESENDSEIRGEESRSVEENNEDFDEEDVQGDRCVDENHTLDENKDGPNAGHENNCTLDVESGDESK